MYYKQHHNRDLPFTRPTTIVGHENSTMIHGSTFMLPKTQLPESGAPKPDEPLLSLKCSLWRIIGLTFSLALL